MFGPSTDQEDIYKTCIQGLLNKTLRGYNSTVMAYG